MPAFAGAIEYRRARAEPTVICLMQSDGAATKATRGRSRSIPWAVFYERVLGRKARFAEAGESLRGTLLERTDRRRLSRKGEAARATHRRDCTSRWRAARTIRRFAPEPFNALASARFFNPCAACSGDVSSCCEQKIAATAGSVSRRGEGGARAREANSRRVSNASSNATLRRQSKIRIHGDYHLGQVLDTGKRFRHPRFRGRARAAVSERKLKRSALRDVAGMMRRFTTRPTPRSGSRPMRDVDIPSAARWADLWYRAMSRTFLAELSRRDRGRVLHPCRTSEDLQVLLDAYLLDKAVYEVGYELNNRPDWVVIPIRGIKHILERS